MNTVSSFVSFFNPLNSPECSTKCQVGTKFLAKMVPSSEWKISVKLHKNIKEQLHVPDSVTQCTALCKYYMSIDQLSGKYVCFEKYIWFHMQKLLEHTVAQFLPAWPLPDLCLINSRHNSYIILSFSVQCDHSVPTVASMLLPVYCWHEVF